MCVCDSVFVSDAVFLCESHYKNVRFSCFLLISQLRFLCLCLFMEE